jgi:hypothetical protein
VVFFGGALRCLACRESPSQNKKWGLREAGPWFFGGALRRLAKKKKAPPKKKKSSQSIASNCNT